MHLLRGFGLPEPGVVFNCLSLSVRLLCRAYYGQEGEVFDKYEDMENLWSYVSHFHAVPFYVYAYAFADLLVGSLYNVYKTRPEGFEDKLLELLAGGGTKDFVAALRPFGLDPSRSEFWTDALTSHLGKQSPCVALPCAPRGFTDVRSEISACLYFALRSQAQCWEKLRQQLQNVGISERQSEESARTVCWLICLVKEVV